MEAKLEGTFSYIREGEFYTIQKNTFPCLKATFDYNEPLPKLIRIEFSDICDANDIAKALSELDAYMKVIRKKLRK